MRREGKVPTVCFSIRYYEMPYKKHIREGSEPFLLYLPIFKAVIAYVFREVGPYMIRFAFVPSINCLKTAVTLLMTP